MIQFKVDKEEKYLEDLYTHLRAHNTSCTGKKDYEQKYVYVVKNDELLGGTHTTLSWDWVSMSKIFYKDITVLEALVAKVYNIYKEKAVGHNVYTYDEQVHKDLLSIGYKELAITKTSELSSAFYISQLENTVIDSKHNYHTITSKECVEEYDVVMNEYYEEYKLKFNEKEPNEKVHYVALDGEEFAGGVYMKFYDDYMYVDLLATKKEYKGQGIGTKLMLFAEELCKEKGIGTISLGTAEFQARPFYEKLGYKVTLTQENKPKGFRCYTLKKHLNDK